MMKTPEQLKGAIRNHAKKKGIHAQEVLQIFMFERIIERLSVSPYPQVFSQAVKGYFASKERDNIRLMEYAKKFHIEEKVQEYMEIL